MVLVWCFVIPIFGTIMATQAAEISPNVIAPMSNMTSFSVGTVLFSGSDINRDCWSPENAALLTTRMLMRHLMPHTSTLKVEDGRFVDDIIDYFRLLLEVIRTSTSGKTKHIMLIALTDTLGGYMKHLILPISKYAFYAGSVDYGSIIKLYQLFDEVKNYLQTNGAGWTRAWRLAGKHIQAKAISLQSPAPTTDPCKGIVYFKHTHSSDNPDSPHPCSMEVPMPFFDSKSHPAAIAVPFKTFGLRNVESRVSAYILVKYFVAVSKCMASRNTKEEDVQRFNGNLFAFIMTKVMPHLCDEKFYAAFGGVLRILETIKQIGTKNGKNMGNFNILPESEDREPYPELSNEDAETGINHIAPHPGGEEGKKSKNNLILLAALATIIIWFCLGAVFVCCRIRVSKMKKEERLKALESTEPDKTPSQSSKSQSKSQMSDPDVCNKGSCPAFEGSSKSTMNDSKKSGPPKSGPQKSVSTKSSTRSNTTDSDTNSKMTGMTNQTAMTATVEKIQIQQATAGTVYGSSKGSHRTPQLSSHAHYLQQQQQNQQPAQIRVHNVQYYPPSYACHTSMTGKVKLDSSTEDFMSREDPKPPFVFGYDFQTTSDDSSPREISDGDNEMGGNMSK